MTIILLSGVMTSSISLRSDAFRPIQTRIALGAGITLVVTTGLIGLFVNIRLSALVSATGEGRVISPASIDLLTWQVTGIVTVASLTALLLLWYVAGRIARPVQQITELAQTAASGDLRIRTDLEADRGTGALAHAFNQMIVLVRGMMRDEQESRVYLEMRVQDYLDYESRVARGDLSNLLEIDESEWTDDDALTVLGRQLNATTCSLRDMILQIRGAAGQLGATSREILATTQQQAAGSSHQAAAISQTTTSVDEIRAIAEQMVIRSQSVADSAQRAVEVAQAGHESVQAAIAGMELPGEPPDRGSGSGPGDICAAF